MNKEEEYFKLGLIPGATLAFLEIFLVSITFSIGLTEIEKVTSSILVNLYLTFLVYPYILYHVLVRARRISKDINIYKISAYSILANIIASSIIYSVSMNNFSIHSMGILPIIVTFITPYIFSKRHEKKSVNWAFNNCNCSNNHGFSTSFITNWFCN